MLFPSVLAAAGPMFVQPHAGSGEGSRQASALVVNYPALAGVVACLIALAALWMPPPTKTEGEEES